MAKQTRQKKKTSKEFTMFENLTAETTSFKHEIVRWLKKFKPKTEKQKLLYESIESTEIVVVNGSAGTGKSYCTFHKALELIIKEDTPYEKLYIINPTVEVGDSIGFLPGEIKQKLAPYNEQSFTTLKKVAGNDVRLEDLIKENKIEFKALNFLRGVTFENCIVVLDEAQNTSFLEMKTFLTRFGENCKYIINGDNDQCDKFKDIKKSGLYDVIERFKDTEGFKIIEFGPEDTVRSEMVKRILKKYSVQS